MSAIEQNIAMQAVRAGRPIPEKILNAPVLNLGLELFLNAYLDLDCERSHSFGPTPIPWTSVKQYCQFYDFDKELTNDVFYHVRKLDDFNLKRIEKKQSSK